MDRGERERVAAATGTHFRASFLANRGSLHYSNPYSNRGATRLYFIVLDGQPDCRNAYGIALFDIAWYT